MNGSAEEFQAILTDALRQGFGGLKHIATASQSAQFYKGVDSNGRAYVIKMFNNVGLFELELLALRSLHGTGRVCDVLYDSSQSEKTAEASSNVRYCIVKPFFDRLLSSETNPIVLLERCAQEADLSARFWEHRWRDFDGRVENDAVTHDGRVIRFDLDGCEAYSFFEPKYTEQFHRRKQTVVRAKILGEVRDHLFREEVELDSLVIRVSRLMLGQYPNEWPTLDSVAEIKDVAESTVKIEEMRAFRALGDALIGPFKRRASEVGSIKRDQKLYDQWLGEWGGAFPAPRFAGDTSTLTADEAIVVGALCHHILSNRGHGFQLTDIYSSLLLLCAAFVVKRFHAIANAQQSVEALVALVNQMPELKGILRSLEDRSPPVARVETPSKAGVYKSQCAYNGGAWKALKKGSNREVEDMVIGRKGPPSIFLLADGVSEGSGAHAIKIVQSAFEPWLESYRPSPKAATLEQLNQVVSQVHSRLLSASGQGACQTTLLVGLVLDAPSSAPSLMIVRYGNSGFIVKHEPEGESGDSVIARSRYTVPSGFLGSLKLDLSADQQIWDLRLELPGIYRIRAFSDGVANGEEGAEALVSTPADIDGLVRKAADWPRETGDVGHDDWSVAGFDVRVTFQNDKTSVASSDRAASEPVPKGDTQVLKALEILDIRAFRLTEAARTFWIGLASSSDPRFRHLRNYPLINRLVGTLPEEATPRAATSQVSADGKSGPIEHLELRRVPKTRRFPSRSRLISAAVIGIILMAVLWVALSRGSRTEPEVVGPIPAPDANKSSPPNRPVSSEPSFDSARQASIYSALLNHRDMTLYNAPKGSGTGTQPLADFLSDLKEVLKRTDFEVLVEVHTDSYAKSGSPEQAALLNKEVSVKRAQAIASLLAQDPALVNRRIRAAGRGSENPLVSPEQTLVDRNRNRRVVVRRTN